MLAQALGEYGLLAGIAEGVTRLSTRADVWVDEWGFSALVVGGIVVGRDEEANPTRCGDQGPGACGVCLVLPPSTVAQAARSSSCLWALGNRLGPAHMITSIPSNKDS